MSAMDMSTLGAAMSKSTPDWSPEFEDFVRKSSSIQDTKRTIGF